MRSLVLLAGLLPNLAVASSPIVASVNERAIHADEVLYFLPRSVGARPSDPVWAAAIDLAVDRRLVLAALERKKEVVSEATIDAEIARLEREFSERGTSLDTRLAQRNMSADSFRHVLRWQLSWKKYLVAALTDENLQRYFHKHQRDFDGTKLRACHILLPGGADAADAAHRLREAQRIHEEILGGAKSFEAAVAEYSTAPSAATGGDVGWIERHQPMSSAFSEAAFRLNPGEISQPVVSPAGIHLIRCTDIRPGNGTWLEAREALVESVQRYLFKWLADQERPRASVSRARTLHRSRPSNLEPD